jgi:hypothetical protein
LSIKYLVDTGNHKDGRFFSPLQLLMGNLTGMSAQSSRLRASDGTKPGDQLKEGKVAYRTLPLDHRCKDSSAASTRESRTSQANSGITRPDGIVAWIGDVVTDDRQFAQAAFQ